MESEGHEEKYRAAVDGGYPGDEPVGQRRAGRVCTIETKASSFTHHRQGVCGQHATEEQCVSSGELAESPGGAGVSGPISVSEVASEALSGVGRMNSTYEAW